MEEEINRHGHCPSCKVNWNAGDVLESLASISAFKHKTKRELNNIAANYGYSESNNVNFSKVIIHELSVDLIFYECPNIRCRHVFNKFTGEEFKSFYEALKTTYDSTVSKIDAIIEKAKEEKELEEGDWD
jgi:tetrahydromethanopterin S-methyltransferase subunit A